jgi:intracellular septation protein
MTQKTPKRMRLTSMFGEILPLSAFFVGFQTGGIFTAAVAAVAASAVAIGLYWMIENRLPRFVIFSTFLSGLLTSAALIATEAMFIKIQPSLFSLFFAVVLLGGLWRGTAMMKLFFGTQFHLTDTTWRLLSLRWGLFMLAAAGANELVWRNVDDADWVFFRVFIMAPTTGLFMLAQLPLTLRGRLLHSDDT